MAPRKAVFALRTRFERLSPLLAVVLLAVALTLAVSGGAAARSTFQSTPLQPVTDTPTPFDSVTIVTDTPPPFDQGQPAAETPTPPGMEALPTETPDPTFAPQEPLPADAPTAEPVPGGPGFLPAPTLTNPKDFLPGTGSLPQAAQAPLTGPAVVAEDNAPADTEPAADVSGAAQLIDSGIRALSYLWLCCGAVLILVAVLVFVWLMRRTRR
jgi:hypothetical protein